MTGAGTDDAKFILNLVRVLEAKASKVRGRFDDDARVLGLQGLRIDLHDIRVICGQIEDALGLKPVAKP